LPPNSGVQPRREAQQSGVRCHKDVKTTMISTRALNRGGHGVRRPLDDER